MGENKKKLERPDRFKKNLIFNFFFQNFQKCIYFEKKIGTQNTD